ncbi:2-amino-4-hydroxy-6-hydroxymethyldihydropteridine diphosphokinase [Sanguibacter sp. YZGR15]|uniref:2-amino-4-hydroxy-6-hydroxymethyldihydropteridine diphosphokinase n=2 Tax=Sanguibacter suaedae TaxID=2795737 RepID=A0A934I5Z9_9MICO|nr:2-amino-4-hydroxy-6-hydroxymethyldihydropteridine diphosphokinase [Sanguibacter suaedae]
MPPLPGIGSPAQSPRAATPPAGEPRATTAAPATPPAVPVAAGRDDVTLDDRDDGPDATTVLNLTMDRMDSLPSAPVDVVLALGANLGEAQETLRRAVAELSALPTVDVVSVGPLARTEAVGGPEQPDYLNTVVLARTTLSARDLLHACQAVEQDHGRTRAERWGPRTLDIDIVLYGALLDSADDLELPHPRAHERAFVLAPWAHVDPDAVLPGLGGGPVAALAATAPDRDGIRWLALDWLQESDDAPGVRRGASHTGPTPTGQAHTGPTRTTDDDPPAQPSAP